MQEQHEHRGILKKDAPSASGRHATWDEDNLARNEDIKAELNPTKIDEPKTPYHAPVDPDVDMQPLDLDSGQPPGATSEPVAAARASDEQVVPSALRSGDSATTSDEGDAAEKQEEFAQHRKQHYDMKNALAAGRALLDNEDEGGAGRAVDSSGT